jgi:hypothetical protein
MSMFIHHITSKSNKESTISLLSVITVNLNWNELDLSRSQTMSRSEVARTLSQCNGFSFGRPSSPVASSCVRTDMLVLLSLPLTNDATGTLVLAMLGPSVCAGLSNRRADDGPLDGSGGGVGGFGVALLLLVAGGGGGGGGRGGAD